ncbi:cob(I)alamin adenosyltransferase [Naumannella halotolerans]|uniref:Corrinoid adenosyltransferase n=1 Tax=Naumannella halotolerans TaxID=993414 RepID=A0A4R7JAH6_9ACTN|nr:cob(I)alamin adenosyltransferase [Naumannella halotolerans]
MPIVDTAVSRRADRGCTVVVLSRIYTRTGDGGSTGLVDSTRVSKTDPRLGAIGDVDEANASIGLALAIGGLEVEVERALGLIQNELFDLGADLATPLADDDTETALRIVPDSVARLEALCDRFGAGLPVLRSFILPGGRPVGAQLHLARTIVRRAERSVWAAIEAHGSGSDDSGPGNGISPLPAIYLNRLSDLLFVLVRVVNGADQETLWQPGAERTDLEQADLEQTGLEPNDPERAD